MSRVGEDRHPEARSSALLRRARHLVRWLAHGAPRALPDRNLLGDRYVEWSWVCAQLPDGPGKALDFGTGQGFLALAAAAAGFDEVTALDLEPQPWHFAHPAITRVRGDILALPLPENSLDLVISCSTVEHVGLTGRYGVEEARSDGDLEAMARLAGALRPSGSMLLTVPAGRDAVFAPNCRVYGRERLPRLLDGYRIEREAYFVKNADNAWRPASADEALATAAYAASDDPHRNYYALGCFVLRVAAPQAP